MVNIPFLGALAGCSARRSERRVASHTSEEQRRNTPGSAAKNGILAFSASLSLWRGRRWPRSKDSGETGLCEAGTRRSGQGESSGAVGIPLLREGEDVNGLTYRWLAALIV